MPWAARRRLIISLVFGAIIVAILSIIFVTVFYKAPSCFDGIQNQGEAGIDCGGPCPYLCNALEQPPTVLFTTVLTDTAGRTDVVASIENKNIDAAAKAVPYNLMLYGINQTLIRKISGVLDLPPNTTETIFIPGVASGAQNIKSAFLSIASSSPRWFTMTTDPRIIPTVSNILQDGSTDAPRIDATLTNNSVTALENVRVIVLVRDAQDNIIAASETIVPTIPTQGTAIATFTWNNAFHGTPVSIEIVPVIPLP